MRMRVGWVRRTLSLGMAGALLTVGSVGCSDSSDSKKSTSQVEKSAVSVSYIPIPPCVPFQIALTNGFFKDEGLTVTPKIAPTAATSSIRLRQGQVEFIFDSNVQLLREHDAGFKVNIVAENDLAPNSGLFISTINPKIRDVTDLRGKKIGFDGAVIELMATISLEARGIDIKRNKIKFVEVPLPKIPEAMTKGVVDAGFLDAGFLDVMEAKASSRRILNMAEGPTSKFPATSYATSAKFAKENPNTVAAFNRAIVRAQQLANNDLNSYIKGLAKMANISEQAASITVPSSGYQYVTTTNLIRLQRVPDQMYRFGYLKRKIDIKELIAPSIPVTPTT